MYTCLEHAQMLPRHLSAEGALWRLLCTLVSSLRRSSATGQLNGRRVTVCTHVLGDSGIAVRGKCSTEWTSQGRRLLCTLL